MKFPKMTVVPKKLEKAGDEGSAVCASLSSTSIRESEGQKDGQKGHKKKRVAPRKGLGEPKNPEETERERSGLSKSQRRKEGLGRAEKSQNPQAKVPLGPYSGTNDKSQPPKQSWAISAGASSPGGKHVKLADAAFLCSMKQSWPTQHFRLL